MLKTSYGGATFNTNNSNNNEGLVMPTTKDSLKQVRSVSRGRPQTASNNLTAKIATLSPDIKKTMRSPRAEQIPT